MSDAFAASWRAEVLTSPPLIAPARQFIWPLAIAGEEDALARGALRLMIRPRVGAPYLVTAALGFTSPSVPTAVFPCPHEDEICAVAGGYAYLANTLTPEHCTLLALKPVAAVDPAIEAGLLLFTGFHHVQAWGRDGLAWQTARLSWEGVRLTEVGPSHAEGFGWNLMTDSEQGFRIDLRDGSHTGGGFG